MDAKLGVMAQPILTQILDRASGATPESRRSKREFYPRDLMPLWMQQFLEGMDGQQLSRIYDIPIMQNAAVSRDTTKTPFHKFFEFYGQNLTFDQGFTPFDTDVVRDPGLNNCFLGTKEREYAYRAFTQQPELYIGATLWFASLFCVGYEIGTNPEFKEPSMLSLRGLKEMWQSARGEFKGDLKYKAARRYFLSLPNMAENLFKDPEQFAGAMAVIAKARDKDSDDIIPVTEEDIVGGMRWFYEKGGFRGGTGEKCPVRLMIYQNSLEPLYKGTPNEAPALVHFVRLARKLINDDKQPEWKKVAENIIKTSARRGTPFKPYPPIPPPSSDVKTPI